MCNIASNGSRLGRAKPLREGKSAPFNYGSRPLIDGVYVGEHHGGIEYRGDGVHYFLKSGNFLEGSFKYSKACGMGTLYTKHGDISYMGDWVFGKRDGSGYQIYPTNPRHFKYQGEWKEDMYHGEGVVFSASKNKVFDGHYRNNLKHGYGTQWKRDGSLSYRGDWSRGKMTGRGYRLHDDGTVIKGYFLDGKAHGFVTIERSNRKKLYEGEAEHGLKHGVGKLFRPSGSPAYNGEFVNDKYHGQGCIFYGGGSIRGNFKFGNPCGRCIFTFKDGSIIVGNFSRRKTRAGGSIT